MKTTRTLPVKEVTNEQETELLPLIRTFESAKRYAFNRLIEGKKGEDLTKILQPLYKLNKRYAEDAVLQAETIISSQRELIPTYLENNQKKLAKTNEKLEAYLTKKKKPKKVPLEVCVKGLEKRKEKLEKKISLYEKYIETNTLPPIIFGGRKNFYKRMKGNISNQEWKELRNKQLYSRGDKSKKGNLNMRIVINEAGDAFLEIANPLGLEEGKKHSPRISLPLHIPNRFYKEITDVVLGKNVGFTKKGKEIIEYQTYSIELIRRNGRYDVCLTYEEEEVGRKLSFLETPISSLIAGIDVNPDRITVTLCTVQGNFYGSKNFFLRDLESFRTEKRETVIGQCVQKIKEWLLKKHVGAIVLEDLKFSQDHDTDKYTNRKFHQFTHQKMIKSIIRMGLRNGFSIKTVNPAYTSVIGKLKYSKKYGLSVHEAAAFTVARRGLHYEEKIPKELVALLKQQIALKLHNILASKEESKGKKDEAKKWLKTVETWKDHHHWKLWSLFHQTMYLSNQQYLFKI